MYAHAQHSGPSTKLVGAITAAAMTAGVAYFLATGMNLVRPPAKDNTMEMVIITPPEPPPPVQEPEPPKVDVPPTPAPAPELVAPDIPFEVPEPVITAPVAEAVPVPDPVPATPAPPSGNSRSSPKLRAGDKPAYPTASVRAGEQGTTHLEVCVSNGGRVTSVSVTGTSGSPRLDDAAAKWIRNERFTPGMIDGVAQNMCGHDVFYEWNLKDARS